MKNSLKCLALACAIVSAWAAAVPAANLDLLNVFPNPVRRYQGMNAVTFANLTPQARIRIYNAVGQLVREVQFSSALTAYNWDLRNNDGNEVASGIYIYIVTNDAGEKKTGKIAVIR